eukprot:5697156-Pyramimonas_sp.AAC.1
MELRVDLVGAVAPTGEPHEAARAIGECRGPLGELLVLVPRLGLLLGHFRLRLLGRPLGHSRLVVLQER